MATKKEPRKEPKRQTQQKPQPRKQSKEKIATGLRVELRSVIRQWEKLRHPLSLGEIVPRPESSPRHRVKGVQSYEDLQERVVQFAGSVWQLKDRFKLFVEAAKLELRDWDAIGRDVPTTIEEQAAKWMPLMLCADLYNAKKHGENRNRSGVDPVVSGVHLDTSTSGILGIWYDGARKIGDILTTNATPVPWGIEILSSDGTYSFGDAVVVVTRAFHYWFPFVRQLGVMDAQDPEWQALLEDLTKIEDWVKVTEPFKPGDAVVNMKPGQPLPK
jgi:hypothetical protein